MKRPFIRAALPMPFEQRRNVPRQANRSAPPVKVPHNCGSLLIGDRPTRSRRARLGVGARESSTPGARRCLGRGVG
eukprot:7275900-Alexandrium_andersonii.AAC.1